MSEARRIARALGITIRLTIPSILAAGEEFSLRISVTGPDALPADDFPHSLSFAGSAGIRGLPADFRFSPGRAASEIPGLRATGEPVALVEAAVVPEETGALPGRVRSNPAWVFEDPPYRVWWGDLHVHTKHSNCSAWRCLGPEWCYLYARDISHLDFSAASDHLRGIASDPGRWENLRETARRFDEPGRFATFLAFESSHDRGFGGDNNAYLLGDRAPFFWLPGKNMEGIAPRVPLEELWRWLDRAGTPYFTVPHHTGRAGKFRSWDEDRYDPVREPLFEIYSSWGSSEKRCSRLPISGGANDSPSFFTDALRAGARFGVIASSDDHATLPGSAHHFRMTPYNTPIPDGHAHKGLAAVRCRRLDRPALFEALRNRDVFATTHARTLVDFSLCGAPMGREITADRSDRGKRPARVRLTIHDSSVARVFLVRNGEDIAHRDIRGPETGNAVNEVVFEDCQPLEKIALRGAKHHPEPFAVYYARVEDGNGAHQWTSPVWIDLP